MYHGLEVDVRFMRTSGETLTDSSAQNEIQALAHMRHPNIVGFLGTCVLVQLRLIVTESMSLGSLESLVLAHKAKRPSWRPAKADTLAWSLGLVRAVNYMHQSDPCIVHRRLSPAVLLMAPGGVLKVSGFESCWRAAGGPHAPAPTHQHPECMAASAPFSQDSRPPAGAPPAAPQDPPSPFAAPELGAGLGRHDSDPAVDIFAVGMLMHFMRAGELCQVPPPHADKRPARPAAAQLGWPDYTAAAEWASAEDPADRPTADVLLGQLEGLQVGVERRRMGSCCAS